MLAKSLTDVAEHLALTVALYRVWLTAASSDVETEVKSDNKSDKMLAISAARAETKLNWLVEKNVLSARADLYEPPTASWSRRSTPKRLRGSDSLGPDSKPFRYSEKGGVGVGRKAIAPAGGAALGPLESNNKLTASRSAGPRHDARRYLQFGSQNNP